MCLIDTDKNGKINYTEFISSCLENSVVLKEQNLKAAFKLLDKDGNGKIEKEQLITMLKCYFVLKQSQEKVLILSMWSRY